MEREDPEILLLSEDDRRNPIEEEDLDILVMSDDNRWVPMDSEDPEILVMSEDNNRIAMENYDPEIFVMSEGNRELPMETDPEILVMSEDNSWVPLEIEDPEISSEDNTKEPVSLGLVNKWCKKTDLVIRKMASDMDDLWFHLRQKKEEFTRIRAWHEKEVLGHLSVDLMTMEDTITSLAEDAQVNKLGLNFFRKYFLMVPVPQLQGEASEIQVNSDLLESKNPLEDWYVKWPESRVMVINVLDLAIRKLKTCAWKLDNVIIALAETNNPTRSYLVELKFTLFELESLFSRFSQARQRATELKSCMP